ncbi:MAG: hypothetical protein Q4E41_08430 [Bacteroidales bacterium]|nr:hypothetical protein [Bacteroidales bacterium]
MADVIHMILPFINRAIRINSISFFPFLAGADAGGINKNDYLCVRKPWNGV